MTPGTEK